MGDLTLICGENNTGKTYATYALYGFLKSWNNLIHFPISNTQVQHLLTDGVLKIELTNAATRMFANACQNYTEQLDGIYAAPEGTFQNSEFHLSTGEIDIRDKEFNSSIGGPKIRFLSSQSTKAVKN